MRGRPKSNTDVDFNTVASAFSKSDPPKKINKRLSNTHKMAILIQNTGKMLIVITESIYC